MNDPTLTPTNPSGPRIRVLIVDDHVLLRQALAHVLQRSAGIEVVGHADNGREATSAAGKLRPDVVLMDMVMPGLNGIDATRQILRAQPKCHILILSAYSDDDRVAQALEAGAAGYLLKSADAEELVEAIRTVHAGRQYLAAEVGREIPPPPASTPLSELTEREREVLQLIAEGMSNSEIAGELTLSIKTVEVHRANVMHKLQAPSHTDVIRYAIQGGLLGLEMPPPLV